MLLAGPCGTHAELAAHHLGEGRPVVSTSDSIEDVRALLDLDAEAQARGVAGRRRCRVLTGLLVRARAPRLGHASTP